MDQSGMGKYCPHCLWQVSLYDKACPQCGHQFRSGMTSSPEALTSDPDSLNKTQMFITLSPDPPPVEPEPESVSAVRFRPHSRRLPFALGVGLALLAAVLIFLWLLKTSS